MAFQHMKGHDHRPKTSMSLFYKPLARGIRPLMSNICILLADGFEELEAVTIIDVLRRSGVRVTLLGVAGLSVRGAHGIVLQADALLADEHHRAWDMVVLPGGQPGANTLRDNAAVQDLIKRQMERKGRMAAICAAPIALAKAGALNGKQATCYPGFEPELAHAVLQSQAVVEDGSVTTSRGPGTAIQFALALATQLAGGARADQVAHDMLVAAPR